MNAPVKLRSRILPALAAMTVAATLALAGWEGYRAVLSRPFKSVVFAGDLDRLSPAELDALSQAVQSADQPSLAAVREAARRVPWVRDATVRRRFPDGVEITFEAHEALARWNEQQLVSRRGEVFTAEDAATLPRFRGPEGVAGAMTEEYPQIVAALAPVASALAELRLTARGAWEVQLESGLTIELGRGDWKTRARRFAAAWPRLADDAHTARYADLRYSNGFAMRRATEIAAPKKK